MAKTYIGGTVIQTVSTGFTALNYTQKKVINLSSFTLQELGDLDGTIVEEVLKPAEIISA